MIQRFFTILVLVSIAGCAPRIKLVHFWSSWCTTCGVELEELKRLSSTSTGRSIEIDAVGTFDSAEAIEKAAKAKNLPFPVVFDEDEKLAKQYSISEVPSTIVLDGEGNPLPVYDPLTEVYSNRLVGARSWAGDRMSRSLYEAIQGPKTRQ